MHNLLPCPGLKLQVVMVLILNLHAPKIILNEDRLYHVVNTPTTRSRKGECNIITQMNDSTKQVCSHLHGENAFLYIAGKLHHSCLVT